MYVPEKESSRAVLIGSAHYTNAQLPELPAVARNVDDLIDLLTTGKQSILDPAKCAILVDPVDARAVGQCLRREASQAIDLFLVYFAGHGLLDSRDDELYLALHETDPDDPFFTAFPFDGIRRVMRDCPARNRVLILDCCFSGRAMGDVMTGHTPVLAKIDVAGTYVLTATPANETAMAPAEATHTAFTGSLLSIFVSISAQSH